MKVIFTGLGGIPCGKRAIDVRIDALAKLTVKVGYKVEVINRFSKTIIEPQGAYEVFDPYSRIKKESWDKLRTLVYYIFALLKEPFVIFRSHKKERVDILVTSSGHFLDILVYKLICKIIGARFVYEYCEYRSEISREGIYHKINGKLLDKISPKLWDGAICISHFLEDACKKVNKKVVTTIVYPLCDFDEFINVKAKNVDYSYIMFCGSVEYKETLEVVVEGFKKSKINHNNKLLLVLRGNQKKIENLSKEKNVIVKSNLEYIELIEYLKGAKALLIPVDNSIRDTARFPNKICEYGAVGGLIITVKNGEMPYVFDDMQNALVANAFNAQSYASKMDVLCDDKVDIDKIKERGAMTCKKLFDLDSNIANITDFYSTLLENSLHKR